MRGDFLDRLDGKLMIRNDDTDNDRPVKRSLWWPVLRTSGWLPCWFVAESSGEYCRDCGQRKDSVAHVTTFVGAPSDIRITGYDGRYGGTLSNGARFGVEIDPRGHAVKIEETPIACPKVRKGIETRFYRGAWQKYLKTQGWVAV